jgi:hypothetical protein
MYLDAPGSLFSPAVATAIDSKREIPVKARTFILTTGAAFALVAPAADSATSKCASQCGVVAKPAAGSHQAIAKRVGKHRPAKSTKGLSKKHVFLRSD